jgi:hypothetical protein
MGASTWILSSLVDAKMEIDTIKRLAVAAAQQLYDHVWQLTITPENLRHWEILMLL